MKPTLVLLAAGMSTRYGRLKQLEPVGPNGEALLDYAVFDAYKVGFRRVLPIIREELEEGFQAHIKGRWPEDMEVVFHHQKLSDLPGIAPEVLAQEEAATVLRERRKPWGTAHALLTAQAQLPEAFVILNADDFYGLEAFHQALDLLQGGILDAGPPPTFGLITYTLAETLSGHGGVNRGICEVDGEGWLAGVRETLEISGSPGNLKGQTVAGEGVGLTGEEPISTNFWIFTPDVFPLLQGAFREFMGEVVQNPEGQPEFLIPPVVNGFLKDGRGRVQCVSTHSRFLGITHPEDRQGVVDGLEEMTAAGDYPRPLWT